MSRLTLLLTALSLGFMLVGCSSGDASADYSTDIKMTDADKAKEKEVMAGQKAPGMATPGQPVGVMPMPGNKHK